MPIPTSAVAFAALAFMLPILLFVTAFLLYRQIVRERRKSSIYHVTGLDPPLGTRDPALLWPSVLATPTASDSPHSKGGSTVVINVDDITMNHRTSHVRSSISRSRSPSDCSSSQNAADSVAGDARPSMGSAAGSSCSPKKQQQLPHAGDADTGAGADVRTGRDQDITVVRPSRDRSRDPTSIAAPSEQVARAAAARRNSSTAAADEERDVRPHS